MVRNHRLASLQGINCQNAILCSVRVEICLFRLDEEQPSSPQPQTALQMIIEVAVVVPQDTTCSYRSSFVCSFALMHHLLTTSSSTNKKVLRVFCSVIAGGMS